MEFLITFEVEQRTGAEAAANDNTAIGLDTAADESELERLLRDLPLADWMQITITPLAPHPNDPAAVVR